MKKILSLFLALAVIFAFSACGENNTDSSSIPADTSSAIQTGEFTAPDSYACILNISINPKFDLYLDADENVIKLHALNDDAKSFENQIDLSDNDLDDVVESIVKTAQGKGFIKGDAPTVSLDLRDIKNSNVHEADVLGDASDAVEDTARELKLNIKVNISITQYSSEPEASNTASTTTSSEKSNQSSAPAENKTSSNLNSATSSTQQDAQAHICIFSPASCEAPATCSCGKTSGKALGHMWDDANCKAPKTCHICKKTEGSVGEHSYQDGKCTVCGASNYLNPKTNLKLEEEYVAQKYYVYDATNVYAPGVSFYNDGGYGEGVYCIMLDAMFTSEPDDDIKGRTPITYNGKKYYRCGAGQSPAYVELTDTEIIITQNPDTVKLVLMADGDLKVTSSTINTLPVGTILSIKWNHLK